MTFVVRFVLGFVSVVGVIWVLAQFAPGPVNRPASTAIAPADVCGTFGSVQSVRLTDTSGYDLYSATCADGVTVTFAK